VGGWAAFHYACVSGHASCAAALIRAGCATEERVKVHRKAARPQPPPPPPPLLCGDVAAVVVRRWVAADRPVPLCEHGREAVQPCHGVRCEVQRWRARSQWWALLTGGGAGRGARAQDYSGGGDRHYVTGKELAEARGFQETARRPSPAAAAHPAARLGADERSLVVSLGTTRVALRAASP
jgi:hypothetical protein